MRKTKNVTIDGEQLTVATIKVGALESIEIAGKKGRQFNIAFVAASVLSSGDTAHGTEAWVREVAVFDAEGGPADFEKLLEATNEVNGFKTVAAKPGEGEPAAPAEA